MKINRPIEAHANQTVVLVAGLPYSGKTAIIEHLQKKMPGKAIYIDSVFREFVPEEGVCLQRWLAEGIRLVDRIIEAIGKASESQIYVEMGILQPQHRNRLMLWIRRSGYRLVPILLQCESKDAIRERQAKRAQSLASQPDKLKIAIDLEELYGPISAAFRKPVDGEGFHVIDTAEAIEDNVKELCRLITNSHKEC
jgi:hypothetical protein